MNTTVEFTANTNISRDKVYTIFDKAFQQFHFVIERLSRFDSKSELSKLNQSAGKKCSVSRELFELIKFALDLARKTNGYFDPTIIDFLESYGYNKQYDFSRLNKPKLVKKEIQKLLKSRPSFNDIKLDKNTKTVTLKKGQRIDLGSIGKGYAIDLAYKKLLPLKNFAINAGGDIRVKGVNRDQKPWKISLNAPTMKLLGYIKLEDRAICCSGSWARKVKSFHHLINPKKGTPTNDLNVVFVIANTAMEADAWSTALYILGNKAEETIKKHKLAALVVTMKQKVSKYSFPSILPLNTD
jgi:thiamine biosynthesis lipoprotein